MAVQVQSAQELFVQGVRLTCFTSDLSLEMNADAVEQTTYCSSGAREFRQGLKTFTLMASGFADYAASTAESTAIPPGEEIIPANLGGARAFSVCPINSTEGSPAYVFGGVYSEMVPLGGAVGDMAPYSVTAIGTMRGFGHRMMRGIVEANRTVTSSSNTTGSNTLGALSATQRLGASLHVLTLSGTSPSIAVKIQSDDNSGFTSATDRITFTTATTRTGEFKDVAGAVTDSYWRVAYTVTGTTPSILFVVTMGIY